MVRWGNGPTGTPKQVLTSPVVAEGGKVLGDGFSFTFRESNSARGSVDDSPVPSTINVRRVVYPPSHRQMDWASVGDRRAVKGREGDEAWIYGCMRFTDGSKRLDGSWAEGRWEDGRNRARKKDGDRERGYGLWSVVWWADFQKRRRVPLPIGR
ncbi:hypothetical protein DPEC_G00358650 [Dallia pectoralis]|uniref:Uncharacterized protein n=1 Tax=Dallia pectoralis TaxID=75939 RepID=A0ACC2F0D6_DALPE|nr:hypothetical protein DPEC_G00358650 [Dallia pectoralis]